LSDHGEKEKMVTLTVRKEEEREKTVGKKKKRLAASDHFPRDGREERKRGHIFIPCKRKKGKENSGKKGGRQAARCTQVTFARDEEEGKGKKGTASKSEGKKRKRRTKEGSAH